MISWISSKNQVPLFICLVVAVHFAQSCPALCNSMDCSTPGFPVLHISQSLQHNKPYWHNNFRFLYSWISQMYNSIKGII